MMPSCDQTGVPIHFHSSITSGSASLMSLRIRPSVLPRQSPSSAILFEIRSDADSFIRWLRRNRGARRLWRVALGAAVRAHPGGGVAVAGSIDAQIEHIRPTVV